MTVVTIKNPIEVVLSVAEEFVGQRESHGSNEGPAITFFNWWMIRLARRFPVGYIRAPYCSNFVNTVGRLGLGAAWPVPVQPKFSDVDVMAQWAASREILFKEGPKRGDLFIVKGKKGGWTHIGFVLGSTDHGVKTLEGNTNRKGSREGDGIYTRYRKNTVDLQYIRWVKAL